MRSPLVPIAAAFLIASIPHAATALDPGGALGNAGAAAGAAGDAAAGALGTAGKAAGDAPGSIGGAGATVGSAAGGAAGAGANAVGAAGGTVGVSQDSVGGAAQAGATLGGGATGALGNPATGRGVDPGGGNVSGGSGTAAPGRGSRGTPRGTAALTAEPPLTREEILRMGGIPPSILLPIVLVPEDDGGGGDAQRSPRRGDGRGSERALQARPLSPVPGVARQTVATCRDTIAAAAKPHGAIRVEAASAGAPSRAGQGAVKAPIEARIVYATGQRVQVRQAKITCQLNAQGRVVALL